MSHSILQFLTRVMLPVYETYDSNIFRSNDYDDNDNNNSKDNTNTSELQVIICNATCLYVALEATGEMEQVLQIE